MRNNDAPRKQRLARNYTEISWAFDTVKWQQIMLQGFCYFRNKMNEKDGETVAQNSWFPLQNVTCSENKSKDTTITPNWPQTRIHHIITENSKRCHGLINYLEQITVCKCSMRFTYALRTRFLQRGILIIFYYNLHISIHRPYNRKSTYSPR